MSQGLRYDKVVLLTRRHLKHGTKKFYAKVEPDIYKTLIERRISNQSYKNKIVGFIATELSKPLGVCLAVFQSRFSIQNFKR